MRSNGRQCGRFTVVSDVSTSSVDDHDHSQSSRIMYPGLSSSRIHIEEGCYDAQQKLSVSIVKLLTSPHSRRSSQAQSVHLVPEVYTERCTIPESDISKVNVIDPWPGIGSLLKRENSWRKCSDQIEFADIKVDKQIGQGAFGVVFKGLLWGQEVALKQLYLKQGTNSIKEFMKEVDIMRNLRHPNIVDFLGVVNPETAPAPDQQSLMVLPELQQLSSTAFIVTELCIKTLDDHLKSLCEQGQRLPLASVLLYAVDIARGLNWLHHKGIIHRDLKPSNVLLDKHGSCKIADFGMALNLRPRRDTINSLTCGFFGVAGTPCYMAPEVITGAQYGSAADVFSFGVLICTLLLGHYPYQGVLQSEGFESAIAAGIRPRIPPCPPALSTLICRCWSDRPEDRPTLDEVLEMLLIIEERTRKMSELSAELMAASILAKHPCTKDLFERQRLCIQRLEGTLFRYKHLIVQMDELISQSDPHVTCFPYASRDGDGHVLNSTRPKHKRSQTMRPDLGSGSEKTLARHQKLQLTHISQEGKSAASFPDEVVQFASPFNLIIRGPMQHECPVLFLAGMYSPSKMGF